MLDLININNLNSNIKKEVIKIKNPIVILEINKMYYKKEEMDKDEKDIAPYCWSSKRLCLRIGIHYSSTK